jgi:hypothetical protein
MRKFASKYAPASSEARFLWTSDKPSRSCQAVPSRNLDYSLQCELRKSKIPRYHMPLTKLAKTLPQGACIQSESTKLKNVTANPRSSFASSVLRAGCLKIHFIHLQASPTRPFSQRHEEPTRAKLSRCGREHFSRRYESICAPHLPAHRSSEIMND